MISTVPSTILNRLIMVASVVMAIALALCIVCWSKSFIAGKISSADKPYIVTVQETKGFYTGYLHGLVFRKFYAPIDFFSHYQIEFRVHKFAPVEEPGTIAALQFLADGQLITSNSQSFNNVIYHYTGRDVTDTQLYFACNRDSLLTLVKAKVVTLRLLPKSGVFREFNVINLVDFQSAIDFIF